MANTIQNDCWSTPEVRACLVQNGDRRDRWTIEFTQPTAAGAGSGSAAPYAWSWGDSRPSRSRIGEPRQIGRWHVASRRIPLASGGRTS